METMVIKASPGQEVKVLARLERIRFSLECVRRILRKRAEQAEALVEVQETLATAGDRGARRATRDRDADHR